MLLSLSGLNAQRLPAPLPVWHASTDALGWAQVARAAAESGARLVSMWGVDRHACEAGAAGHVAAPPARTRSGGGPEPARIGSP